MLIFYADITKKKFSCFSLPDFLLEIHNSYGAFFEKGGGRGRGFLSEIRNFDRKYLLNVPIQKKKLALLVMLSSFLIHNSCLSYPVIYT